MLEVFLGLSGGVSVPGGWRFLEVHYLPLLEEVEVSLEHVSFLFCLEGTRSLHWRISLLSFILHATCWSTISLGEFPVAISPDGLTAGRLWNFLLECFSLYYSFLLWRLEFLTAFLLTLCFLTPLESPLYSAISFDLPLIFSSLLGC